MITSFFTQRKIWANAEDASTTLQIPLEALQTMLRGIYDAELGGEIDGYRWRYAEADAVVTEKASYYYFRSMLGGGKKCLSETRIGRLNSIGFDWRVNTKDEVTDQVSVNADQGRYGSVSCYPFCLRTTINPFMFSFFSLRFIAK